MNTKQPHRTPIREDWAKSLLQAPVQGGQTTYYQLKEAWGAWERALTEAREVLKQNPLAPTVAEAVAREGGRRGEAVLLLDDRGEMYLEVEKREWNSSLPCLESLRQEAEGLGIDPKPFGRSRTELAEAIAAKRATRPKMRKTAPCIGPVEEVPYPPDTDIGDLTPDPT